MSSQVYRYIEAGMHAQAKEKKEHGTERGCRAMYARSFVKYERIKLLASSCNTTYSKTSTITLGAFRLPSYVDSGNARASWHHSRVCIYCYCPITTGSFTFSENVVQPFWISMLLINMFVITCPHTIQTYLRFLHV
jgi:hypothetical protein